MISAPQPEAAEAAADVLRQRGNVVDATVTAALVQTVVDPQMCGIAGMGCMHLYVPRAYPDIYLTLGEANTTRLVAGLREGTLDAVILRPGTPGSEELQVRRLSEEPMVGRCPQASSCCCTRRDQSGDIEGRSVIGPPLYDTIVGACRNAGFEPTIGQVAPQMASIVNLVAAELGVSIVPASIIQLRVAGVAYRQIAGQSTTTQLALAYRRGETSPVVRNFIARAVS